MKKTTWNTIKYILIGLSSILIFSGCTATSAPEPTKIKAYTKDFKINSNDTVFVTVNAKEELTITEAEKNRLAEKVKKEIDILKMNNPKTAKSNQYELDIKLLKYEKGNAFARMLLAGLGQIHIDANTNVFVLPTKSKVTEFNLNKTFAWGGIYGASTTMETVEEGFAKGIAEAVTQNKKK